MMSPSFFIESKPRIDDIDFVTYILGAFGFWFGLSFLSINPVPCFLAITDSNGVAIEQSPNEVGLEGVVTAHEFNHFKAQNRILIQSMNARLHRFDNAIKNMKYRLDDM